MPRLACVLLSAVILAVLFYTSLAPLAAPQPFTGSDKWLHMAVYSFVSFWFVSVLPRRRLWVLLGCIGLGLCLEYLQGLTQHRHSDPVDALANTAGCLVGLGLSIVLTPLLQRWANATV